MSPTTLDLPSPQPAAAHPIAHAASSPALPTAATRIYRGRTIEELLPKIQAELGADAVVVRREKGLTGGFAGFFQRPFVEIEARRGTPAIDCYDGDGAPALPDLPPASAQAAADHASDLLEEFHELTPAGLDEQPRPRNGSHVPVPIHDSVPFAAALAEAEAAVLPSAEEEPAAIDPPPLHVAPAAATPPAGRTRTSIERTLLEAGMDAELTRELIETAAAHVLPLMPGRPSLARAVHTALARRIPGCPPLPAGNATIAVVGPGGAGKSALCAALLGAYRRRSTLPATCTTLAHDANQAAKATVRAAREQGVLLLDTPACSPADPAAIRALAAQLHELKPDCVVVALPATLGAKPAAQLLEALMPLKASALAITHIDETNQLGVAASAACAAGLGPVHLLGRLERARTTGGLTPTDPADLAERLLPVR
jgi:flagellar biosynthesis GTPase FlhF